MSGLLTLVKQVTKTAMALSHVRIRGALVLDFAAWMLVFVEFILVPYAS